MTEGVNAKDMCKKYKKVLYSILLCVLCWKKRKKVVVKTPIMMYDYHNRIPNQSTVERGDGNYDSSGLFLCIRQLI